MADEAGPSGAGTGKVDAAVLAEADRKFEQGIQCIRTNDLDAAVQLLAEVLQVRVEHYGDLAPECASAYFRYGSCLLYQAQDSSDVFGSSMKEGAGEEEAEDDEEEAEDKENGGDKGKAPAVAAEGGEGDDDSAGEATDNDLQLAWENLESAKVIWSKDAQPNAAALADVHGLLGDVAMESDDFATALAELDAALGHLAGITQPDDRRLAEVQYKRCCALQFSGDVDTALVAVQSACACLALRREVLCAKLAAPAEGDNTEQLKTESEDVTTLLDDLKEKVVELQDLIAQNVDTKNMIKNTFAQLAAVGGGASGAAPAGEAAEQPAAAAPAGAGGEESEGFGAAGTAAGGGGGGGSGAVQNLGVVGRGTKRINLQPVQTNVPAAVPGAAAGSAAEPAAKKKRSLEDLMGGDGGETNIGFGGFGSAPAPVAPATTAPEPAVAAAPAVPVFLQAASIKAVYGGSDAAAGEQKQ